MARVVRLFISSPGDVAAERWRAEQVAKRLGGLIDGLKIETYRWEEGRYFSAHAGFQEQIPDAESFDIVVALFWTRLGSPLPATFPSMPDGRPYPSGTAFEVLRAIEHRQRAGTSSPDVLVYRKMAPPPVSVDNAQLRAAQVAALDALDAFMTEWFFNPADGFKAAFTPFRDTDEFASLFETHLRAWIRDNCRSGNERLWRVEECGSPFRGLAAFEASHRKVFFGRRSDVERARERLEAAAAAGCAFLLIDGASGTGKSSLAKAGLLPRLVEFEPEPRTVVLVPGPDPLLVLSEAFFAPGALPELASGDAGTAAQLAAHFAGGGSLAPVLRALDRAGDAARIRDGRLVAPTVRLVVLVDQMEGLFMSSVDPQSRDQFAATLASLAHSGRALVVATMRADGRPAALEQPDLAGLIDSGAGLALRPPGPAALEEIVRGPAEAAGLAFERRPEDGLGLDEVVLRDAGGPEMLPLLQFVLDQLYEAAAERARASARPFGEAGSEEAVGTLSFADYHGLDEAVEQAAERAFAGLPAAAQAALPRLVRALSEPGPSGAPVLRPAPAADAAPDEAGQALAAALVDARVLSRDGDILCFVHETSLRGWGRAARAAEAARGFLRIRADVAHSQARWEAAGRPRSLLLPAGLPLAEADAMLTTYPDELRESRNFIQHSRRRAQLGQTALLATALILALVAALALLSYDQARQNAALAATAQLQAEENAALAEAAAVVAAAEADLLREFSRSRPGSPTLQHDVALALGESRGRHLSAGDRAGAGTALGEALTLFRTFPVEDADDSQRVRYVAGLLDRLGDSHWFVGDAAGALEAYEEMLAKLRVLADREPDSSELALALIMALTKVARASASDAGQNFLEEALERVSVLEAQGLLGDGQSSWPVIIRAALAESDKR